MQTDMPSLLLVICQKFSWRLITLVQVTCLQHVRENINIKYLRSNLNNRDFFLMVFGISYENFMK